MPVSGLIVKQILQELTQAGETIRATAPGLGPCHPAPCPGLQLPRWASLKPHTCGEGASRPSFQGFRTQKKPLCPPPWQAFSPRLLPLPDNRAFEGRASLLWPGGFLRWHFRR